MLGGATAGMQAVQCSGQAGIYNLHRFRVEVFNTLNLYKTQYISTKTESGHPRPMRGATSLHIPCVSAPVSPAGGDTGQGWENVSTQLRSHDTRPTFTRE